MSKLLLVDDDEQMRSVLALFLRRAGFSVLEAGTCAEGNKLLQHESPDLLIVDYDLPDGTAFELLKGIEQRASGEAAIVLTGMGTIELAVQAIKAGAEHFLTKPVDLESLEVLVRRTLDGQRDRRRKLNAAASRRKLDPFIGKSKRIVELERLSKAIVDSDSPVLILGETGTGKGVLARYLHDNGPRKAHAFVDLNCAGFSRELVEAELFGYQRGAFTGAVHHKPGLFEVADKGTLFLDEIGELELGVQPKLLKALEERSFRRLGELTPRSSDARFIAATHRALGALVKQGRFREDLLYRVNTLTLELPPLRERPEDLPELCHTVLEDLASRSGRPVPVLASDAQEALARYAWPGNIRELRNVLERALLFCRKDTLDRSALHFDRSFDSDEDGGEPETLEEAERSHILRVLRRSGGRVEQAAKVLGVSRSSLYAKLKRHGIRATEDP